MATHYNFKKIQVVPTSKVNILCILAAWLFYFSCLHHICVLDMAFTQYDILFSRILSILYYQRLKEKLQLLFISEEIFLFIIHLIHCSSCHILKSMSIAGQVNDKDHICVVFVICHTIVFVMK